MDKNGKENQCRIINRSVQSRLLNNNIAKYLLNEEQCFREAKVGETFSDRSNKYDKSLSILKESALLAIAEKQEQIDCLLNRLSIQQSFQAAQNQFEIQDMQNKIQILLNQKEENQKQIQNQLIQFKRERQRWEQEYERLIWQKEAFQELIQKYQQQNQQLKDKISEICIQYNQICKTYKYLADQNNAYTNRSSIKNEQQGIFFIQKRLLQQKRLKLLQLSEQKEQLILFNENQIVQNMIKDRENPSKSKLFQNKKIDTQLFRFQEDWPTKQNSCENSSIAPNKHCLEASLKAINLVQNFNINPQRCLDTQSQFTTQYFSYDNQILINQNEHQVASGVYQSCNNIQEDPQQLLQEQSNQEPSKSHDNDSGKQKVLWGVGGAIVGALLVLIFKY